MLQCLYLLISRISNSCTFHHVLDKKISCRQKKNSSTSKSQKELYQRLHDDDDDYGKKDIYKTPCTVLKLHSRQAAAAKIHPLLPLT